MPSTGNFHGNDGTLIESCKTKKGKKKGKCAPSYRKPHIEKRSNKLPMPMFDLHVSAPINFLGGGSLGKKEGKEKTRNFCRKEFSQAFVPLGEEP